VDEALLRTLTPTVIGILVRRGADFAAAEDAVQDALVEAVRVWPDDPPRDPKGWLVTVAWRKFLDAARADTSRRHREVRVEREPDARPGRGGGRHAPAVLPVRAPVPDTGSAVALTLRAVGGLTTRQIAQAYLVPEATMAQRISRAKRTVSGVRFNQPVTSPRCCACSTWSSTRATPATSTSPPRRSGSLANWRPRHSMRRPRACWR
jgi:predicted RNA polymerase sigma factor